MNASGYVGRFAPTPSGPLHFGSLLAAVGSYLQARQAQGRWLVRIEDLDRARCVPGADTAILTALGSFGFEWDGTIEYQSRRSAHYARALEQLAQRACVFACTCSRAQVAASNVQLESDLESRYPGFCRKKGLALTTPDAALRFIASPGRISFEDLLQGCRSVDVAATSGDFVLRRRDGIYAYHLAVVVDDFLQGVTEIVRGADLLSSAARHLLLQSTLGYPTPRYCHLPLALDEHGTKLSKSSQSIAIEPAQAAPTLWQALHILRQRPPIELQRGSIAELWRWAIGAWSLEPLQGVVSCAAPVAGHSAEAP